MVTSGHIDVLVKALVVEADLGVSLDNADEVGQVLRRENATSLFWRYGHRADGMVGDDHLDGHYRFHGVEAPLDDGAVLTAVRCYAYQSCEHDGWPDSEACRLVDELSERIIERHGGVEPPYGFDAGWGWGFTAIEQAVVGANREPATGWRARAAVRSARARTDAGLGRF
jgi:hypothetical protein